MKKDLVWFILLFCSLQLFIMMFYPNMVYAMSPEDIKDICSADNTAYVEVQKYWATHLYERDAYALNQRSIYLNNATNVAEPFDYPFNSDSLSSQCSSNPVNYKSKVAYFFNKYLNKLNCFN